MRNFVPQHNNTMDKELYIKNAFDSIAAKNMSVPFEIADGCDVTDITKYLNSLKAAYLNANDPRLEKLFYDKIEQLKQL